MGTRVSTSDALWSHADRFFIGGDWMQPSTANTIQVINPTTEEIYAEVAEAQSHDVQCAVAAARTAFDLGPWPKMSHQERAAFLSAIADQVRLRTADIAADWTSHMGIVYGVAEAFTGAVADAYDQYAEYARTFDFVEQHNPTAGGQSGFLVREPVGVVAAIIPWNAPILLIAHKLAPALLAGCTVVLKAAPEAPGAAYIMAEIALFVGLPPGVLNVVTAERAVSEELVRHPGVDKVSFTGSTAAGRRVAALCGDRIARCTLELGGKSAAVILDDVDVAVAAHAIAGSGILLSGQVCSSLTRIIISKHRHDELVDALSTAFASTRMGDPFDPNSQMGPLAMRRQLNRVEEMVAAGLAEGAILATGGQRPRHLNRGFFFEPTVFCNVDNKSTIATQEIFGPVLSVVPAADESQAVDLANDTPFGLNASVFTGDPARAYAVARQLRAGTIGHNAFRTDFGIAFGGFKQSGIGREGGTEGLLSYLETKTIILNDQV